MSDLNGLTQNQLRAHLAMECPKQNMLYRFFMTGLILSAGLLVMSGNPIALPLIWLPFIGITIWRFVVVAKGISHNGKTMGRIEGYSEGFGVLLMRTAAQGFVLLIASFIAIAGAGPSSKERAQEAAEIQKDQDKRAPRMCPMYFADMGKPGSDVYWKDYKWCDPYPQFDHRTGIDRQSTTASTKPDTSGLWK